MTIISSNKTIAKNTLLLYVRMLFTLLVSLYTSRVILSVLGVVDNGIYNVVGGAVGMFSFLNGALSGATSRFLTFELGSGNEERLKNTFAASLTVHLIVAVVIVLLVEIVGLWFLNNKLDIPAERMHAARVAFHLSVVATVISITQVPYSASLIAHEKMGAFAYMSILEVSLKLGICYLIMVSPFDKLITYAVLILLIKALTQSIYRVYCIRRFPECHLIKVEDKGVFKPILTFSGWDLFGNLSCVARNQGIDMILNMFFGPVINSAAGFAGTVGNAVNGFANNFLTAIKPPIVKAYSIGDHAKMEELMITASKFAFSLLALLSTPLFFESQFVMKLWLKTPPDHTAMLCSIGLAEDLLASVFLPLVYAIHASGKIRFMSIVNGSIWILSVPITYAIFVKGAFPESAYLVRIGLYFFVVISNLYSTKKNIVEFDVTLYLRKTIAPAVLSMCIALPVTYLVYLQFDGPSWARFLTTCVVSTLSVSASVFFLVLDKDMRKQVISKICSYLNIKNG